MGREQFSGIVTVQQESTFLTPNTLWGTLTIGTTYVAAKVGSGLLADRSSVTISSHPDNTDNIYLAVGNSSSSVTTANYGLVLTPGQIIQLKLDSKQVTGISLISGTANQKVGIIEGK